MKLAELLLEDAGKPLELRDVIKFFPHTYAKVIKQKWGGGQLMYHGHPFFANGEIGSAYEKAEEAVDYLLNDDDFTNEIQIDVDDVSFTVEAPVGEKQEVYMGYSPDRDCLYIGYDVWVHEEKFNEEWDSEFERATGEQYDEENPEHHAAFQTAWKQFGQSSFLGMLFRVNADPSGDFIAEEELTMPGGFYKGVRRSSVFKNLDLVDIRLD